MQGHHQQTDCHTPESDSTRALQAFRTIVTLLSLIQSERKDEKQNTHNAEVKKELQLLDALAGVAIRKNDVVAVVARPDGSGNLQVIASVTHSIRTRERLTAPQQSSGCFQYLWFWLARNARSILGATQLSTAASPPPLPSATPNPVDPESSVPQHLKDCASSEDLLRVFLTHEWRAHSHDFVLTFVYATHYRPTLQDTIDSGESSFNIHIWMISKLITNHPSFFAVYIVATCYEKMHIRVTYRTSQVLFKDLFNNSGTSINVSHRSDSSNPSEMKSDEDFISQLQKSEYGLGLQMQIAAHGLEAKNFYGHRTCEMFHKVLCELLRAFIEALENIQAAQSNNVSLDNLMERLEKTVKIGSILRLMIRGAAIKAHFQNLNGSLSNMPVVSPKEVEQEEAEFVECHSTVPKWTRSIKLLKMLMIHFDAIQVLAHFVTSKSILTDGGKVDIWVLHQPPPGDNEPMLIWKDLLQNKKLFPISPHTKKTAAEMIKFLDTMEAVDKKAVDKKAVDKKAVVKKAMDKKAVDKKHNPQSVVEQLVHLVAT